MTGALRGADALLASQGEQALLGLASVDIVFPRLPDDERTALKMALVAAAVPHWCDASLLTALLLLSPATARRTAEHLLQLGVVESFAARGEGAFNVQSGFRTAIRTYLRTHSRQTWLDFSERAHRHLSERQDPVASIERLYHHFAFAAGDATAACRELDSAFVATGALDARFLMGSVMEELVGEDWLQGAARVEANLIPLSLSGYRLNSAGRSAALGALIEAADQSGYAQGAERARVLLGDTLKDQGKPERALDWYRQSFDICRQQLARGRDLPHWTHRLGVVSSRIAQSHQGRPDLAIRAANDYLDVAQELAQDGERAADPAVLRRLGLAHVQVGSALEANGQEAKAAPHFQQALSVAQHLVAIDPDNVDWQRDLSVAHSRVGGIEESLGDLARAQEHFGADLQILRRLTESDPGNLRWQHDLALSLAQWGRIQENTQRIGDALSSQQERLQVLDRLVEHDPSNLNWMRSRGAALRSLADILGQLGRPDEALPVAEAACDVFRDLVAGAPDHLGWQRELAVTTRQLGEVLQGLGRSDEALARFGDYLAVSQALVHQRPQPSGHLLRGVAVAHARMAVCLRERGEAVQAHNQEWQAVQAMLQAVDSAPQRADWAGELEAFQQGRFS